MVVPRQENSVRERVTVILPTYGRPDALVCAVQSVQFQTISNWRLLIIGDACNDVTRAAITPYLIDSRIKYVNLPWRCGEQALLNSAGMAVAQSEFIAFLNHDDLWTPDHLELACRTLQESGGDFFIGRSAWIWESTSDSLELPSIDCVSSGLRDFTKIFSSGYHYIEPVSSWVITRALAQQVGPWKKALDLYRTPIQDWALRAHRSGAQLTGIPKVTSFKFENHWARNSPIRKYEVLATSQKVLLSALAEPTRLLALTKMLEQLSNSTGAIGRSMQLQLAFSNHSLLSRLKKFLLSPLMAYVYIYTGFDTYSWYCSASKIPRGDWWFDGLKKRTGESNILPPKLSDVINCVSMHLR